MLNIYSKVEDLRCTEHYAKEDELKELLLKEFTDYCEDNDIEYDWLSDDTIEVLEDTEDLREQLEEEIQDELDLVYEEFFDSL